MEPCPFCALPEERVALRHGPCLAAYDLHPVSAGHLLIIPLRHVHSFRDMTGEEWQAVHEIAREMWKRIRAEDTSVEGFNLGINDGTVAGQTIAHAHVHLIPRRRGDVPDPVGGVRAIFPRKANYLRRKQNQSPASEDSAAGAAS